MVNFLIIIMFLAAGFAGRKSRRLPAQASKWLNNYVIWICLPAVVINKVPNLQINQSLFVVGLVAWSSVAMGVLLSLIVARWLELKKSELGCLMMVTGFGNTSFFGLPMLLALIGPTAIPIAVFYDQIGSFLSLAILGNIILANYAVQADFTTADNAESKFKQILIKVVAFPPFISLLVAAFFGNYWLGEILNQLFEMIGKTLTPATMFLVGLHLQFRLQADDHKPLAAALAIKLVFLPVISLIILKGLGLTGLIAQVTLLESAMPPMVTASVMAIHAGLAPRLAAAAVGYGLFVSLISLPLWNWLSHMVF